MKTILLFIAGIITSSLSFADTNLNGDPTNVVLSSFTGMYTDQNQVQLSWYTMMEANVEDYEIQRSGDGINFVKIDTVASQMKISTSVYQLQYAYADKSPLIGISYYRLKVVGKDGSTSLSPVIEINNSVVEGTRIYPTVIQNNMIFVESDKNLHGAKLEFFDLSGKKISETNWEYLNGRQNTQVSKSGYLPTGTYVARLTASGQNVKNQLIIVANRL